MQSYTSDVTVTATEPRVANAAIGAYLEGRERGQSGHRSGDTYAVYFTAEPGTEAEVLATILAPDPAVHDKLVQQAKDGAGPLVRDDVVDYRFVKWTPPRAY